MNKTELLNYNLIHLSNGYKDYLNLKVEYDLPHLTFYEYCKLYYLMLEV